MAHPRAFLNFFRKNRKFTQFSQKRQQTPIGLSRAKAIKFCFLGDYFFMRHGAPLLFWVIRPDCRKSNIIECGRASGVPANCPLHEDFNGA